MNQEFKTKKETIRIAGRLNELITIRDLQGNILKKALLPLMVEFKIKDVLQIAIGAALLSLPISFTQEVWDLGESLPLNNILLILLISLLLIGGFVYYHSYRKRFKQHKFEFLKRIFFTYLISFGVVAGILTLIQQAPWSTDWILAIKRIIIVTFPAAMSATLADTIK